ncbi:MAG: N-6 DNA methylase, partial [Armatimonadota bacterium]
MPEESRDLFKKLYHYLLPREIRHNLGEYYTPDWLCDKVVQSLPFQPSSRVLDPACGSGSFLRAAVARLKELKPDATAEALAQQVGGIDIHPLSVQI